MLVCTFLALLLLPVVLLLIIPIATGFAGYMIFLYTIGVADALNLNRRRPLSVPVKPPPNVHQDGRDPAWPHYLYGPALADYRQAVRLGFKLPWARFRYRRRQIVYRFYRSKTVPALFGWTIGALLLVSMHFGGLIGAVALGVISVLQALPFLLLATLVFLFLQTLRGVDTLRLRLKGIGLFCSSCHQRVVYPVYACPACRRQHRDVRPGRYGVLRRTCACGNRMPTLLLLGSSALQAACPHCGESMASHAGTSPEFVLPVLGAPVSGKTRLMLAVVMAMLEESQRRQTVWAAFADAPSHDSYTRFAPVLRRGEDTWKTQMPGDRPLRGYSLYIEARRGTRRLLHLFDPAGEVVETSDRLLDQRYISAARTFVFTLDQLSVTALWDSLEEQARADYARYRSERPPETVFSQILSGIEEQGVTAARARLAVVLTKQDLVRTNVPAGGSDEIRTWLASPEIGLGNMVREMDLAFREVRFFRITSRIEDGVIDPVISEMTRWILKGEGFKL